MTQAVDDLDIVVTVTRSGDTDLALEDPANGYEVVSIGPGGRTWRRSVVEGRYVHGRQVVSQVIDTRTMPIIIRISGDTWAQVRTRAQAMFDALSQSVYLITTTIEGVTDYHVCESADITIVGGDVWQKHQMMARQQEYQISIPYDPVRTSLS